MLPHRFICRFASSKLGYKHRGMEERCWQRARCGGLRRHRHPPALLGGCRGTITLWPHQGTAEALSPSGPVGGLQRHRHPPAPLGGCRGTVTLQLHWGAAEVPSPSGPIGGLPRHRPSPSGPVRGLLRHHHPPAPLWGLPRYHHPPALSGGCGDTVTLRPHLGRSPLPARRSAALLLLFAEQNQLCASELTG